MFRLLFLKKSQVIDQHKFEMATCKGFARQRVLMPESSLLNKKNFVGSPVIVQERKLEKPGIPEVFEYLGVGHLNDIGIVPVLVFSPVVPLLKGHGRHIQHKSRK